MFSEICKKYDIVECAALVGLAANNIVVEEATDVKIKNALNLSSAILIMISYEAMKEQMGDLAELITNNYED